MVSSKNVKFVPIIRYACLNDTEIVNARERQGMIDSRRLTAAAGIFLLSREPPWVRVELLWEFW
jgi:hypothetical protein